MPYNGYSEEYLDRLEPNGNIPTDKSFNKREFIFFREITREN